MPSEPISKSFFQWAENLHEELEFWSYWAESNGAPNPEHHAERTNPATPIQTRIVEYGRNLGKAKLDVLDVGSGPLTKSWPSVANRYGNKCAYLRPASPRLYRSL